MSGILISEVSKEFGRTVALDGVTLEIQEGEFFSLLGPSGCGKTTLLNIIAGFLDATAGSVALGGQEITHLPPHRRNIGMVFQSYALFPHMTVFENVAYGLRVRKLPRPDVARRVTEALQLVHLADYAQRMPHQLSGGQQQRVAIARALAVQPSVLLLDEPLSNLDAKLRKEMQTELRSLQQRVGITTVLVTHDQEEAMALSDRVGVMGEGRLQQVGTPSEIYHRPVNRFVASFIGEANLLTGDSLRQAVPAGNLTGEGLWMLRPERIRVALAGADPAVSASLDPAVSTRPTDLAGPAMSVGVGAEHQVEAELLQATYVGSVYRLRFRTAGGGLELAAAASDSSLSAMPRPGQRFHLSWEASDLVQLHDEGESDGGGGV